MFGWLTNVPFALELADQVLLREAKLRALALEEFRAPEFGRGFFDSKERRKNFDLAWRQLGMMRSLVPPNFFLGSNDQPVDYDLAIKCFSVALEYCPQSEFPLDWKFFPDQPDWFDRWARRFSRDTSVKISVVSASPC